MELFNDIYNYFRLLTVVDIVFLMAIITLLILLVTLVYFIKINKDVFEEQKVEEKNSDLVEEINAIIETAALENVSEVEEYNDEKEAVLNLQDLTEKLAANKGNEEINCDKYEQEQEAKAIISYEELLNKKNKYAINYEKEEILDDLIVKKVNLQDLVNVNEEIAVEDEIRVISYQKEEDFLKALKELNSLLNWGILCIFILKHLDVK